MPDLSTDLLPRLKAHRLPGLELGKSGGEVVIYPNYHGQSILNIPSSLCRIFGAPSLGAEPLIPEILHPLEDGVERVIFILMDALGLKNLQQWLAEGRLPLWNRLVEEGMLAPITSITPSTTASALPSLWTGCSVTKHGIAGYELWLKEYGIVANMITHAPMSFQKSDCPTASLACAGFDPDTFVPFKTLGTHLREHGVKTYAFQHYNLVHSGLSRLFFKDVSVQPFSTSANLWINLRQLLENPHGRRFYAWVYWSEVDHQSHIYGPGGERPHAEFAEFSAAMERLFFKELSSPARKGTLLILAADHGQIYTPLDPHYELRSHPSLARRLHIFPTGENRMAYLYIKPGQSEAVREYIEKTWPGQFSLLDPAYVVDQGLFGPGDPHPMLRERLGDLIAAGRGNAYLWWAQQENFMNGRHGGLSAEEMLVPFVAVRL